jgi:chaperonin GroES
MSAVATPSVLDVIQPTGYRLLIRLRELGEMTRGGIVMPGAARAALEAATQMGEVLAMGDTAYRDREKFPGEPWCEVGDIVLMREYSGTRFKVDGVEYRLINDDTVEAVVHRPELVTRAV